MSCPLKKSWKLRWRNARKVAGNPILAAAEPFRAWFSELAVLGGLVKAESFNSWLGCRCSMLRFNRELRLSALRRDPLPPQLGTSQVPRDRVESERDHVGPFSIEAGLGFGLWRCFPIRPVLRRIKEGHSLTPRLSAAVSVLSVLWGLAFVLKGTLVRNSVTKVTSRNSHPFITGGDRVHN